MKQRIAVIDGERVSIAWNETDHVIEATVNGRTYKLETRRVGPRAFWFGWNGLSLEALVRTEAQGYSVLIRGHQILVEFLDSTTRPHRHAVAARGLAEIRAPMPGKIVRVLLQKDDEVETHQGVVVMEAMKMQNEIRSPKRGRIVQLAVKEGDAVKSGDLIAQVE